MKILSVASLSLVSTLPLVSLPPDLQELLDTDSTLGDFRRIPQENGERQPYSLLELTVESYITQEDGQLLLSIFSAEWLGNRHLREFRGQLLVDPQDGYAWEEMLNRLPAAIMVLAEYQGHTENEDSVPRFFGHWFRRLRP